VSVGFPLNRRRLVISAACWSPPAASAEVAVAWPTGVTVVNCSAANGRLLGLWAGASRCVRRPACSVAVLLQLLDPSLPLGWPPRSEQVQSCPAMLLLLWGALMIKPELKAC